MGIAQSAGHDVPVIVGAAGIVIAAASNNILRDVTPMAFRPKTGLRASACSRAWLWQGRCRWYGYQMAISPLVPDT
jgi:hypothetical protein